MREEGKDVSDLMQVIAVPQIGEVVKWVKK
jgi:hypothetical protein